MEGRNSTAFSKGLGKSAAAVKSPEQIKQAKLRKARAKAKRAEEQRKKLLKQGIHVEVDEKPAGDDEEAYDLEGALNTGPNRFTFFSSVYWQQQQQKIEEKIEERYFNAPVSEEVMEELIKETAEDFAEDMIKRASEDSVPSIAELWHTILRERNEDGPLFEINDWVEFLDDDMCWKLGKVVKCFRGFIDDGEPGKPIEYMKEKGDDDDEEEEEEEEEDEDIEYMFNVEGCHKNLNLSELRCSEEGLKRLFGNGPWIWQQYCLLRLEKKLRYQRNHPNDFETINIMDFSRKAFDKWVNDPKNLDFRRVFFDDRIGEVGRESLRVHICKPFEIINHIASHSEGWEPSESTEFSIFSYSSIFGSGFPFPIIVLAIQFALPGVLVYVNFSGASLSFEKFFCVQNDEDASMEVVNLTTVMVMMIQLLYSTQIVVDRLISFFASLGVDLGFGTYDVFYRFKALRTIIRENRYESALQSVGYTIDLIMNTLYVCLLYIVNVLNIITAPAPFEVLLNALALEFVGTIDEEFAQSTWWDSDRRWIRAGGVSIALQAHIDKKTLKSSKRFSEKFGINHNVLKFKFGSDIEDTPFLKNKQLALEDSADITLMSTSDRVEFDLAALAKKLDNAEAINYNMKQPVYFGGFDKHILGTKAVKPLFMRYIDYRTWSMWSEILYLADVPKLERKGTKKDKSVFKDNIVRGEPEFNPYWMNYEASDDVQFINWYGKPPHPTMKALSAIFTTLFFIELFEKLHDSIKERNYKDTVFWFFDAIIEWVSYLLQIIFPFYLISGLFISLFFCYGKEFDVSDDDDV